MRKSIVLGIVVAVFALCVSAQASALSWEMANQGPDFELNEDVYVPPFTVEEDDGYTLYPLNPGIPVHPDVPFSPIPDTDGDGYYDFEDDDDDGDEILDDGDGSGVIGDNPCTDGNVEDCDDNCRLSVNPEQGDYDKDGVGDWCDICPVDPDPAHQATADCVAPVVDDDDDVADDESDDEATSGDDDFDFGDPDVDAGDDGLGSDVSGLDYLGDGVDSEASGDGAGGCSMAPAAAANPITLILISLSLVPLAIRRKK